MLQAGDSTEFAEVVGLDTLSGAAVLPHILKTYRHSGHQSNLLIDFIGKNGSRNNVRENFLLTNDTYCDFLQLFAERGYRLKSCSFEKF